MILDLPSGSRGDSIKGVDRRVCFSRQTGAITFDSSAILSDAVYFRAEISAAVRLWPVFVRSPTHFVRVPRHLSESYELPPANRGSHSKKTKTSYVVCDFRTKDAGLR